MSTAHNLLRLAAMTSLSHRPTNPTIELELHKGLLLAPLQASKAMATRVQSREMHRDRREFCLLRTICPDHLIKMHNPPECLDLINTLYPRSSNSLHLHLRLRSDQLPI
ncbi:hypothetical protein G6011_01760 [Alternaria panax]|uniref:Uncharacterized protein n=1 Tax=Alternaria panax TaxID=48097 RepID=A0AAD4ILJ2_9PLEO|nr:hypothetical protein G6011_01760 [Alternaria panax]